MVGSTFCKQAAQDSRQNTDLCIDVKTTKTNQHNWSRKTFVHNTTFQMLTSVSDDLIRSNSLFTRCGKFLL